MTKDEFIIKWCIDTNSIGVQQIKADLDLLFTEYFKKDKVLMEFVEQIDHYKILYETSIFSIFELQKKIKELQS